MKIRNIIFLLYLLCLSSIAKSQNDFKISVGIISGIEKAGFSKNVDKDGFIASRFLPNFSGNYCYGLSLSLNNEKLFNPEISIINSSYYNWEPYKDLETYEGSKSNIQYYSVNLRKRLNRYNSKRLLFYAEGGVDLMMMQNEFIVRRLENEPLNIQTVNPAAGIHYGFSIDYSINPYCILLLKANAGNAFFSTNYIIEKSIFSYKLNLGCKINLIRKKNIYQ